MLDSAEAAGFVKKPRCVALGCLAREISSIAIRPMDNLSNS